MTVVTVSALRDELASHHADVYWESSALRALSYFSRSGVAQHGVIVDVGAAAKDYEAAAVSYFAAKSKSGDPSELLRSHHIFEVVRWLQSDCCTKLGGNGGVEEVDCVEESVEG